MSDETERLDDLYSEEEAKNEYLIHCRLNEKHNVLRFNVAGTSFRKDQLDVVHKHYLKRKANGFHTEISLVPEPTNQYDPNAVKVLAFMDTQKLANPEMIFFGYVPKKETNMVCDWRHRHPNHTIRIAYMGDNHTGTGNIGCIVELKETN